MHHQDPRSLPPSSSQHRLPVQWQDLLRQAAERHSKILAVACRLVHPAAIAPAFAETHLRTFLGAFLAQLHAKRLDPAHLAVTSGGDAYGPISHLVLVLMDGHRTQSGIGHLRLARAIWADTLGLPNSEDLVLPCLSPQGDNGMKLRRDRPDWLGQLESCHRWGNSLIATRVTTNPTTGIAL